MNASPFAKLSPELRNLIYEFAFSCDAMRIEAFPPGLTRTCRQIRGESLQLSYSALEALVFTISTGSSVNFACIEWPKRQQRGDLDHVKAVRLETGNESMDSEYAASWRSLCQSLLDAGLEIDRVQLSLPRSPFDPRNRDARGLADVRCPSLLTWLRWQAVGTLTADFVPRMERSLKSRDGVIANGGAGRYRMKSLWAEEEKKEATDSDAVRTRNSWSDEQRELWVA